VEHKVLSPINTDFHLSWGWGRRRGRDLLRTFDITSNGALVVDTDRSLTTLVGAEACITHNLLKKTFGARKNLYHALKLLELARRGV
tara:strand:- start:71 stop:331 length:261 start_codon:yes stop_codon:yes gene_type:complete